MKIKMSWKQFVNRALEQVAGSGFGEEWLEATATFMVKDPGREREEIIRLPDYVLITLDEGEEVSKDD